ncbi:cathepsin B (C01 family) [Schistosoma mansoni]|uniref:cathepsin B (C01 family) n=1 Tax=Schistosoma mansoni TaxID=6183 RepID=UPI00022DC8F7|nr:cathepsin B (C01 family) [Schistosoma mansoni]|eukprot:XP_018647793.1 cathepsin B (C01 family) [Schistosoma mansoni]
MFYFILLLSLLLNIVYNYELNPLKNEHIEPLFEKLIKYVNQNPGFGWKAGINSRFRNLKDTKKLFKNNIKIKDLGGKRIQTISHRNVNMVIPHTFDARDHWVNCSTIKQIHDECCCRADWVSEKIYNVYADQEDIQKEILMNGPVIASILVKVDFLVYKSGVYFPTPKSSNLGWINLRIIGWGYEGKTPYWLCANSWSKEWGENGYVKVRRGVQAGYIESYVRAPIPKI